MSHVQSVTVDHAWFMGLLEHGTLINPLLGEDYHIVSIAKNGDAFDVVTDHAEFGRRRNVMASSDLLEYTPRSQPAPDPRDIEIDALRKALKSVCYQLRGAGSLALDSYVTSQQAYDALIIARNALKMESP